MIPKIIHYCWFGGNTMPELALKCIGSWKKYCPEYEIKEWNEGNVDLNCCDYVREAYSAKKWAFVSDYIPVLIFLPNILSQGIRGNLSRFLYFNAIYIIPGMYFIAWIYVVSPVAFGYVPYKFMW